MTLSAFEEEREMMLRVQEADFVVVELTLYTDTHPDDEEALEQWRESIKKAADNSTPIRKPLWAFVTIINSFRRGN